jgi:ribosomal protein L37E
MASVSHVKCPNCGVFNTNKEYCESCNTLISHQKKEVVRATQVQEKEISLAKEELEKQTFIKKLRKHPFFLMRFFGFILHSVWIILNIIGGLVAWFVAMVAAG